MIHLRDPAHSGLSDQVYQQNVEFLVKRHELLKSESSGSLQAHQVEHICPRKPRKGCWQWGREGVSTSARSQHCNLSCNMQYAICNIWVIALSLSVSTNIEQPRVYAHIGAVFCRPWTASNSHIDWCPLMLLFNSAMCTQTLIDCFGAWAI